MSIVGPRPHALAHDSLYDRMITTYAFRHHVKPGITGLAQVMGRYSTSAERKLRFDLIYVFKYSPLLDIKILFQTVRVVFQREQAEGMNHEGDAAKMPLQAFHNFAPQDASTSSI